MDIVVPKVAGIILSVSDRQFLPRSARHSCGLCEPLLQLDDKLDQCRAPSAPWIIDKEAL